MGLFSEFFFFGFFWLMNLSGGADAVYFSVMSFVGYDYRKERKGVLVDDDDGSPLENFGDENDNKTTTSS